MQAISSLPESSADLSFYGRGAKPDPNMPVDEWSDRFMRLPAGGSAEPGKFYVSRVPHARDIMRCLSPDHPAKRVVAMVASQLMKTQIGINWILSSIHQSPANTLVLLPNLSLSKRVSSRISKSIDVIPVLQDRVAQQRSRDGRNTIDTKEFVGGTLYITTAGSAANIAEIPARYLYGDEIDRWEVSLDGEGDPVDLAETRTSVFGRNAKIYLTSSPTIEGESRIETLFRQGNQCHRYVPCPHCGEFQTLEWESLWWSDDVESVAYVCKECAAHIEESHKTRMFLDGEWRPHTKGDGETYSFTLSALYAPFGGVSWKSLVHQYLKAKEADANGDPWRMQVFYNTRLARTWNQTREMTRPAELHARAEPYPLRTVPEGIVILTASVDVQDDRLEFLIKGWGEGLERWTLDYQAIHGDPALPDVWKQLDELIKTPLRNVFGVNMKIRATAIDSGGHYTQEVYEFARERKAHGVFAVKGASRPGRPVIAQLPSRVDVNIRGKTERNGASLWIVGTDTAKDWLYSRLRIPSGHGGCHFSQELPLDYYDQLCSERRLIKYIKGHKRAEWVKARADRNEALDLDVYALAAAHRIGLHKWRENDWERERKKLVAKRPTPASVVQEDVAVIKPGESGAPRRLTITSKLA